MGLAAALVCATFYAGIFGIFTLIVFIPGAVALVCAFRFKSDFGRAAGLVASVACLPVIYLGGAALAQYGLPHFGS